MRTYVVSGSASGQGLAVATRLQSKGHRVIGVDLKDADVRVDLSSDEGRKRMVDEVASLSNGTIDAVISCAGVFGGPLSIPVNYFGAVATLEGLRPLLENSPAPRAAVISSVATYFPHDEELLQITLAGDEAGAIAYEAEHRGTPTDDLIYATSKRALTMWMRRNAATDAWAGKGIPLNAIGPGTVATPMAADMLATEESRRKQMETVPSPLNGFTQPETPAALLDWLTSEENTHLCGQMIFIDGGADVVLRGDLAW